MLFVSWLEQLVNGLASMIKQFLSFSNERHEYRLVCDNFYL